MGFPLQVAVQQLCDLKNVLTHIMIDSNVTNVCVKIIKRVKIDHKSHYVTNIVLTTNVSFKLRILRYDETSIVRASSECSYNPSNSRGKYLYSTTKTNERWGRYGD